MIRSERRRLLCVLALSCVCVPAFAATAGAEASASGGGMAFERPDVTALKCGTGDRTACPRGYVLRVSGAGLARTRLVTFLGAKGARDDRTARPTERSPHRVIVKVPASARSGPIRVVADAATATGPALRVLPTRVARPAEGRHAVAASPGAGVFPVQGPHDYGTATNRFGGERHHQGQDVLADCGTPLVAALAGEVTIAKWQGRAGNYVVIKADDGTSQAYMHLREPASVAKGQRVTAGEQLGVVGRTGDASACHLHFELWTAPGWYEGGTPVDPLATLRGWDAPAPPAKP